MASPLKTNSVAGTIRTGSVCPKLLDHLSHAETCCLKSSGLKQ